MLMDVSGHFPMNKQKYRAILCVLVYISIESFNRTPSSVQGKCYQFLPCALICCCFVLFFVDFLHVDKSSSRKKERKKVVFNFFFNIHFLYSMVTY